MKALEAHLPIFWIVVVDAPERWSAIAPPERREWLPTFSAGMPYFSSRSSRHASLTAWLMALERISLSSKSLLRYMLIGVLMSFVCW